MQFVSQQLRNQPSSKEIHSLRTKHIYEQMMCLKGHIDDVLILLTILFGKN
jgi:hypothetical protein